MKIFFLMLNALCIFGTVHANQSDTFFATVSDLEDQVVESLQGELYVEIDEVLYPIAALQVDDECFCFLKTGERDSADSEMACLLGCPNCGRVQTCRLTARNKGRCSKCKNIFPANFTTWKCKKCKTQNYITDTCGNLWCRCPRWICEAEEEG